MFWHLSILDASTEPLLLFTRIARSDHMICSPLIINRVKVIVTPGVRLSNKCESSMLDRFRVRARYGGVLDLISFYV